MEEADNSVAADVQLMMEMEDAVTRRIAGVIADMLIPPHYNAGIKTHIANGADTQSMRGVLLFNLGQALVMESTVQNMVRSLVREEINRVVSVVVRDELRRVIVAPEQSYLTATAPTTALKLDTR